MSHFDGLSVTLVVRLSLSKADKNQNKNESNIYQSWLSSIKPDIVFSNNISTLEKDKIDLNLVLLKVFL